MEPSGSTGGSSTDPPEWAASDVSPILIRRQQSIPRRLLEKPQ
jgi:hypothetical protein